MSLVIQSLTYFHFSEALIDALECNFPRLHFYSISQTLVACKAIQFRFVKVITLLKASFNKVSLKKI